MEIKNKAQDRAETALARAQQRMREEGHVYPSFVGTTPSEHLDAIAAYNAIENKYMHEYLRMPSGPRPVLEYPSSKPARVKSKPFKSLNESDDWSPFND